VAGSEGEGERGVEFGGIEGVVDVLELGFGFWLRGGACRDGESKVWEGNTEESVEAGDGGDGGCIEGSPGTDLANVPPEMFGVGVTHVNVKLADQSRSGIGGSEVSHQGCGVAVIEGSGH